MKKLLFLCALSPPFTCLKVLKVYDGDTILVHIPRVPKLFSTMGVRVLGIDAPEMRTKDKCEKAKALLAKKAVEDFIKDKCVTLVNPVWDKYARILSAVEVKGKSLSEELLSRGLAIPYHGERKTKHNWCDTSLQ